MLWFALNHNTIIVKISVTLKLVRLSHPKCLSQFNWDVCPTLKYPSYLKWYVQPTQILHLYLNKFLGECILNKILGLYLRFNSHPSFTQGLCLRLAGGREKGIVYLTMIHTSKEAFLLEEYGIINNFGLKYFFIVYMVTGQ